MNPSLQEELEYFIEVVAFSNHNYIEAVTLARYVLWARLLHERIQATKKGHPTE